MEQHINYVDGGKDMQVKDLILALQQLDQDAYVQVHGEMCESDEYESARHLHYWEIPYHPGIRKVVRIN